MFEILKQSFLMKYLFLSWFGIEIVAWRTENEDSESDKPDWCKFGVSAERLHLSMPVTYPTLKEHIIALRFAR